VPLIVVVVVFKKMKKTLIKNDSLRLDLQDLLGITETKIEIIKILIKFAKNNGGYIKVEDLEGMKEGIIGEAEKRKIVNKLLKED
jgi:hypothetical protein